MSFDKLKSCSLVILAVIALIALTTPSAFGTVLGPPGTLSASGPGTDFSTACSGLTCLGAVVVGPTTANVSIKTAGGATTGTGKLVYEVVQDTANPSNLDFLYQYQLISGDITSFTVSDFTGFTTDIGYVTSFTGFANSTNAATSISNSTGATVNFGYSPALLASAGSTEILVVRTNATTQNLTGNASLNDTGTASVIVYAPAPEPAQAGLVVGVLFGTGLWLARRYRLIQS
jgi:hypothetical protein